MTRSLLLPLLCLFAIGCTDASDAPVASAPSDSPAASAPAAPDTDGPSASYQASGEVTLEESGWSILDGSQSETYSGPPYFVVGLHQQGNPLVNALRLDGVPYDSPVGTAHPLMGPEARDTHGGASLAPDGLDNTATSYVATEGSITLTEVTDGTVSATFEIEMAPATASRELAPGAAPTVTVTGSFRDLPLPERD
ncbi:MAG: hypothetical protein AAF791_00350 [Bacteroidota bacterium]